MARVAVYIDGYNLYYGLRSKGWRRYYWLDLHALSLNLLKQGQTLAQLKYFTTVVRYPKGRHDRQADYLEVLSTLPDIEVFYGHFLSEKITCRRCRHNYITHHEKMTDVNIAVEMLTDAFRDRFDLALLISADSDLVGTIKSLKQLFPSKKVIVAFPPNRVSKDLKRFSHGSTHISRNTLAKSQFPLKVQKPDGFVIRKPRQWK